MVLSWIGHGPACGRTPPGMIRDRLLRERRRQYRQRKVRRRLGDDPSMAIGSPSEAIEIAEALLECVPRQHTNEALWVTVAVRPLAELLYAASVQGNAGGIEWASHALVNIDANETVPGWRQADEIYRRATAADSAAQSLPGALLRIAALPSRQRHAVSYMMHAAIAPWLAPGHSVR
jgi:hypothetical protein